MPEKQEKVLTEQEKLKIKDLLAKEKNHSLTEEERMRMRALRRKALEMIVYEATI